MLRQGDLRRWCSMKYPKDRSLTPHERRASRKAKRIAPRRLNVDTDGSPLSDNAQRLQQNCGDLHRRVETSSEAAFRQIAERASAITGCPFRRQIPVAFSAEVFFIMDLYFDRNRVNAEVDGREHFTAKAREKDAWRDGVLRQKGIRVFRCTNKEVADSPDKVLVRLIQFLIEHSIRKERVRLRKKLAPNWRTEVGSSERLPAGLSQSEATARLERLDSGENPERSPRE